MNKKTLGFLVRLVLCGIIIGQLALPAAYASDDAARGRLTVSGVGTVEVKPDQATVSLRLSTLAPEAAEAQRLNAQKATAVEAVLQQLGIAPEQIRTRSMSLREEWEYVDNERVLRGYRAEHVLAVTVYDLENVGALMDRVIEEAGAQVQGVEFGLRDRREAERLALQEAFNHAASRAQTLARLAGITLGPPSLIVDESAVVAPLPIAMDQALLRAASFEASTPVHPGLIRVDARVRLEYQY